MAHYPHNHGAEPCPFLEDQDERCASHFTLGRLSQAFGHCLSGYRGCSVYHQLAKEQPRRLLLTSVTHHGRPLQQTGT